MNYSTMKKADLVARIQQLEAQSNTAMQVTDCKIFPFTEGPSMGHIKALANIILGDQFMIRGLRVMDGDNGLFVGYPVDPFFKGEDYRSVCNPITRAMREHIEAAVLTKYQQVIAEATNG
ncbi:stage V sporulation protein G [Fibrobacter sp. UWB15]|jgi:stage V sporulation protein G|uniref:SpoVG family protein n=1 Tax=unclassified Fibrobacter TaxID=2634177 RepID=UPI0009210567|nr:MULTISPECIES: SpoVG family protein [unclassified Fibrobacter]PWJ67940.1 stage V sporulation protein G [Fibrobacter sp. UWB6]SHF82509.1 stage V sporulation protein G [Fibrobacter sp. UWB8]SMG16533.1 stage V sporulation protein G [Fibrobacter sp. UWB15]